ncbi:MAG: hypothetical protein QOE83_2119 [Actinomycetota bacterium]|nr:hypothetical protein [Actinomycetota bacterium]
MRSLLDYVERMIAKTDRSAMWLYVIGVFLFLLLSLGAAAFAGMFSGMVLVAASLNLRRSRRSGDKRRRITAWICISLAWIGGGLGFWFWDWFLWDEHYHPGAGGAIAPPTGWDLATMPLISAGLGLVLLVLIVACNAWLKWSIAHATRRRLGQPTA